MRRIVAKNIVVAVGALLPLLAIDYFYVRSDANQDSIWFSTWMNVPAFLIAPVGFFWANWKLVGPSLKTKQVLAVATFAILVSAVWLLLLAWAVVANFHMAMGGRL